MELGYVIVLRPTKRRSNELFVGWSVLRYIGFWTFGDSECMGVICIICWLGFLSSPSRAGSGFDSSDPFSFL